MSVRLSFIFLYHFLNSLLQSFSAAFLCYMQGIWNNSIISSQFSEKDIIASGLTTRILEGILSINLLELGESVDQE